MTKRMFQPNSTINMLYQSVQYSSHFTQFYKFEFTLLLYSSYKIIERILVFRSFPLSCAYSHFLKLLPKVYFSKNYLRLILAHFLHFMGGFGWVVVSGSESLQSSIGSLSSGPSFSLAFSSYQLILIFYFQKNHLEAHIFFIS